MNKKTFSVLFFCIFVLGVIILVFTSIFVSTFVAKKKLPSIDYYGFPIRYLGDNFTNIYRIKLGQQGTLLYYNAYANEDSPPVFFGTHYNVLGLVTKPLNLNPFEIYEFFRLLAIVVFIITISFLNYKLINSLVGRILGLVLFITATPVWQPVFSSSYLSIIEPRTYSDYFNVFTKIHSMKAHHLFAQVVMMMLFYFYTKEGSFKNKIVILFLLSLALGFLHPYLAMYSGIFITVYTIVQLLIMRKNYLQSLIPFVVVLLTLIPLVVYHGYVLDTLWKVEVDMQGTTVWVPRTYSFSTYIFALGPVLFLSVPALFIKKIRTSPLYIMLALWGYLPLLLFFLPDIRIPMSAYRLFQSYQQIPLAILAAAVVVNLFSKRRSMYLFTTTGLILFSVLYAYLPYKKEFEDHVNPAGFFFRTQQIISQARPIFSKLQELTPENSVVLASEQVSLALPIYTHNKVIIGHPGTNPHHQEELEIGNQILAGQIPVNHLASILKKYSISYILFGTEFPWGQSPRFEQTPYMNLNFLEKIYSTENVDLVAVKNF